MWIWYFVEQIFRIYAYALHWLHGNRLRTVFLAVVVPVSKAVLKLFNRISKTSSHNYDSIHALTTVLGSRSTVKSFNNSQIFVFMLLKIRQKKCYITEVSYLWPRSTKSRDIMHFRTITWFKFQSLEDPAVRKKDWINWVEQCLIQNILKPWKYSSQFQSAVTCRQCMFFSYLQCVGVGNVNAAKTRNSDTQLYFTKYWRFYSN